MGVPNQFLDIPGEVLARDAVEFAAILKGRRVVLDVGCGHGDFLLEFAPKNPDILYVGIEIWRKRAHKTAHRLHKRNIANYRVIVAPGEVALRSFFPNGSVDELHVNFPEPWLRERYFKHRIWRPSFLIETMRVLKPGGVVNLVTDIEEYAVIGAEAVAEIPGFVNNYPEPVLKDIYESFPTLFYEKMSAVRHINYVSFKKA